MSPVLPRHRSLNAPVGHHPHDGNNHIAGGCDPRLRKCLRIGPTPILNEACDLIRYEGGDEVTRRSLGADLTVVTGTHDRL